MRICPENTTNTVFNKGNYNILIVEDSKFVNKLLCDTLSKYGYHVQTSHTLAEARAALSASRFDLILLDLHLPDGDSDGLIEEMKNVPETKIIVLTADDDQMTREHVFQQGVLDYFNKDNKLPFTISLINNIIEEIQQNSAASILIIDDSMLVRSLLSILLSPRNYNIMTANNAQEGLKILKEQEIDLVILDMELPDMHGTKVLNMIKADTATMQIEVIVLSGTSEPNIISTVLKQGACSFIKKPFASEELIHSVDTWISYRREKLLRACQQHTLQEYKYAIDRNSIVSITNEKGIITSANENFCKISGYSKEELIGKPHNIVRHPDEDPSVFKELWATIQAKKPWSGRLKNLAKDGHTYYVDTTISPLLNIDGSIKEYLAIRHDITQIMQTHNQLNDELNEKDALISMQSRQAAMGEMLSMITHQWKQPLSTMSAISNRMQMDIALEKIDVQNLEKYAKTIEEQVQYLSQTIDDFKNFLKPSTGKELTKVSDVIENTMKLMERLIQDKQIDVVMNLESTSMIETYPRELVQVLIKLIKNAADAFEQRTAENKSISIETKENEKHVTIEVQDNAGGIPPELLEKIFEPYFTTKDKSKGTGLGLHICKSIMQEHMNGDITVSNTPNGARFILQLPK